MRLILVSSDPRFLKVTGFLLSRSGNDVEIAATLADVTALTERFAPDAIVLDSSDSLDEAAAFVAVMARRWPRVAVVVVADGDLPGPQRLDLMLFPKWRGLESLYEVLGEARRLQNAAPALAD